MRPVLGLKKKESCDTLMLEGGFIPRDIEVASRTVRRAATLLEVNGGAVEAAMCRGVLPNCGRNELRATSAI
uniref:Uncharacterized protein n=1 Tax=Chromera velia CCMP2878 TaxID=1169474 RepID=A0A0G4HSS6_9ALVE|eukprot:Cvel_8349.t1-p1 / transcript=Cvel_8349.t1 / gene=Cvel_8349 / organism=Chromera_velia_CCMP2878 / gene_product=hypothetical protein / transcript_product=hypothetical protein / location=Cvel_scaffold459:74450-78657(-) / protein_length=71 / sequence_SO=supercontig / SO=protein_coding / is_pseudo=false